MGCDVANVASSRNTQLHIVCGLHLKMENLAHISYTPTVLPLLTTYSCALHLQNKKLTAENAEQLRMLVQQIAEQNREEDRKQKVRVEQVALALRDKFVYVQDSEKEVEGETGMLWQGKGEQGQGQRV